MTTAIHELRRSVVRAARTSTEDVDRRLSRRDGVNLACRVSVTGHGGA